jgi:hypothetical protein
MQQNENIQLLPIIEADPVKFTMDTIGWKVLFFMLILTVVFIAYNYYMNYKKNAYRRDAISIISEIALRNNNSMSALIAQIMFQLKRTALQSYDKKTVASLEGIKWLHFLDEKGKGNTFSKYQEIITDAVYKNEFKNRNDFNRDEFVNMSINWIKKHA